MIKQASFLGSVADTEAEHLEQSIPSSRVTTHPWRRIQAAGLISLLAWAAVYILLFAHTLWHSPTLIPDHWPQVFYPIEKLFPSDWIHAHRDVPEGWPNILAWLVLAAILLVTWAWAVRTASRLHTFDQRVIRDGKWVVFTGVVLFSIVLVLSPGFTSSDLFSYIWYGKMAAVYHVSPYTHGPNFFRYQDYLGWLQWVYWKDQPTVYGPAWVWPAAAIAAIAQRLGGDIVFHLLGHRLLAAVFHLANTGLIWVLAGHFFRGRPAQRLAATIFYGWCPLVVWEFANNGHNDALMVFWILAAVALHIRGAARPADLGRGVWWVAAAAALTLAGLVKASGFLLLPAYLVLLFHSIGGPYRFRRRLLLGSAIAAAGAVLAAGLYWPFWDGPVTLQALITAPGNERYVNSLGQVLRFRGPEILYTLGTWLGRHESTWTVAAIGDSMEGWVRLLCLGVTAAIGLGLSLRVRDLTGLLRAWGWMLVAYLLLGAMWFWPWYITWFLPMAALLGPGRLRTTAALYAVGGMALYGIFPLLPPPLNDVEGYVPLICFGPVAVYLLRCTAGDMNRLAGRLLRDRLPLPVVRRRWPSPSPSGEGGN